MYPQPRRFLWYLLFIVLILFAIKNPDAAGHLAHQCGQLLVDAASALSKVAGSL